MNRLKILILGAGIGQLPLIKRAKCDGYYVIVVSPQGDYPGFLLADKCVYLDLSDIDAILKLSIEENIDAIATDQTDLSISTVDFIIKKLNLPGIQCKDIDNFRDKSKMRDVCKKAGIPTIPFQIVTSYEDAIPFFEENNCDVIVKPINSQGSRGVNRATNLSELRYAFDEALKYSLLSVYIIIEKFINGNEIEVDTIVNNGVCSSTLIGDVYKFSSENAFSSYERIYPTRLSAKLKEKIILINTLTLKHLGIIKGWVHGEYIIDDKDEVYLLEVGARGGGNFVGSHIIAEMLGVSTDEMALRTAVGDESFYNEISLRNTCCACKSFFLPKGEIVSVKIDRKFLDEEYVIGHNLEYIDNIKYTKENTDKTSRFTIVVKSSNQLDLKNILDEIPNHIDIKVKTNKGIENIIWK